MGPRLAHMIAYVEDELAVVPFIEIELAMGFRPVSIERTSGAVR